MKTEGQNKNTCISKKRRDKLRSEGLCYYCGKEPARDGMVSGESCARKNKIYSKMKFDLHKASGICVQCWKKPARDGHVTCEPCVKDMIRRTTKKRKSGLCYYCCSAKPTVGIYCESCAPKARKIGSRNMAKRRARFANEGMCNICGGERGEFAALTGRVWCPTCTEKRANEYVQQKARRL